MVVKYDFSKFSKGIKSDECNFYFISEEQNAWGCLKRAAFFFYKIDILAFLDSNIQGFNIYFVLFLLCYLQDGFQLFKYG